MTRGFAIALGAFLALTLGLSTVASAQSEGRQKLGYGLLFTNDVLGDTDDRWRTGSITSSRVWGPAWQGHAPERIGQILEFRFHGEVIAPENLSRPAALDRPYVGALGFGLHTHFQKAQVDYALGADLIVTGPQTQLDDFQDFLHGFLGGRDVGRRVRRNQIDDGIRPSGVFEASREFELGHRYRVVLAEQAGTAFLLGADIAYVDDSDYLPARSGVTLTEDRTRVRAGLHWENRNGAALFYGLTWLSEEFDEQRVGQFLGAVQFRLRF